MATPNNTDPTKVRLRNVRLSFPHLFKPHSMEEGQEAKYSAAFLLDPTVNAAEIATLKTAINHVAKMEWKDKIPAGVKPCLRDGNEKAELDGYEGTMFVPSSSKRKPVVVDEHVQDLYEADGKPYAGCYVNATVRLWAQDNKFGKRVNAELLAIQFVRDGEAFGVAPVKAEDEFSPVDPSSVPATVTQTTKPNTVASLF